MIPRLPFFKKRNPTSDSEVLHAHYTSQGIISVHTDGKYTLQDQEGKTHSTYYTRMRHSPRNQTISAINEEGDIIAIANDRFLLLLKIKERRLHHHASVKTTDSIHGMVFVPSTKMLVCSVGNTLQTIDYSTYGLPNVEEHLECEQPLRDLKCSPDGAHIMGLPVTISPRRSLSSSLNNSQRRSKSGSLNNSQRHSPSESLSSSPIRSLNSSPFRASNSSGKTSSGKNLTPQSGVQTYELNLLYNFFATLHFFSPLSKDCPSREVKIYCPKDYPSRALCFA